MLTHERSIAALLFLVFSGIFAGGCRDETEGHQEIRLVWFGGEAEESAIRECLSDFESSHPGHRVTLQMVEWTRFNEKVMTMLMGRRPPDVSRMSVQWCRRYQELGALADVGPLLASPELGDFLPSRLASCRAGDQLFGLPHTSIGLLTYFNRDLLDAAGVDPPDSTDSAWSWEEFSDAAQAVQRATGVRHGWALYRGWFPMLAFFYQNGGHLLSDGEPDFANVANVQALQWVVDQHRRGVAPKTSWTRGGDAAETLFLRGDCAMVITGNWRLRPYSRQIKDFEWGVAPLPSQRRRACNTGGENLVVFNTPRAQAAALLVEFLAQPEQMERFCAETLFLPTRRSLLLRDLRYRSHTDAMNLFARQSLDFEPEWAIEQGTPEFAAIDSALVRQFELAVMGHRSPEESLESLNAEYLQARLQ
jgi:multiple sugar transport system substrate-binding protein